MNFGLYIIITKPILPYTEIAEICVRQNIKYLQLREKDIDDRALLGIAREIKSVTKGSETKFVINDRVDICLLSDADGLHLGQDDVSFQDVKQILPENKVIGLSTHNFEQAMDALRYAPDYIGFGPVYKTPTKRKPDPVVGCDNLKHIVSISQRPVVAIGGIDENNIHDVLATGAKNICMVRYFMEAKDLEDRIKKINELIWS